MTPRTSMMVPPPAMAAVGAGHAFFLPAKGRSVAREAGASRRTLYRLAAAVDLIVEHTRAGLADADFERQLGCLPDADAARLRRFADRAAACESLQGLRLMCEFAHAWTSANGMAGGIVARDSRGKPYLAGCRGRAPALNLSHGGGYVVLAVAGRGPVGVDVEPCRPLRPALLAACCRPRERAWIDSAVTPQERRMRFARLWTLKEALMKACGEGLAIDPLDVEFDLSRAPRLLRSPCGTHWRFFSLSLDEHTQLAICHAVDGAVTTPAGRIVRQSSSREPTWSRAAILTPARRHGAHSWE